MSLSEAYPTQNCCNLRARRPRVRVQIPRQAEARQPTRDRIPGQVEGDGLPRIGSLGRLRRDDLLGPLGLVDPRAD